MRLIASLLAAGTIALAAAPAKAQQSTPPPGSLALPPGTRVRIMGANLVTPLLASFLETRGDTLIFIEESAGRGIWQFTLDQITSLERTAGERKLYRPYVARGALYGAAGGAVAGLIFAGTASPSDPDRRYNRPLTLLLGGAAGAAIGAFIGSRFATERWTPVPLPRRVSVLPGRHGSLRIIIAF